MRARIEVHQHRVRIELLLALVAAAWVLWVLAARPDSVLGIRFDRFAHFPLSLGLGVWLPLLARSRWSTLGDLRPEGGALVIRGERRVRRIPLRRVRGVRVAPGARGASVLVELEGGDVLAAALDDLEDARRLADEIRRDAKARDGVAVRSSTFGVAASILRPAASLFALGYFLHVVPHVIGGSKAFYGISALLVAAALLLIHVLRQRLVGWDPAAGGIAGSRAWEYARAMRAHLALHGRAADGKDAGAPRPRLAEHGETLGAWLARLRRELASPEAYRGAGEGMFAKIEHAYRSAEVPLRERALALRILTKGEAGEVRRRIAEIEPLAAEEQAWIESVALAEDDDRALARVERRPPDFRA